jgi:hypothetical protein
MHTKFAHTVPSYTYPLATAPPPLPPSTHTHTARGHTHTTHRAQLSRSEIATPQPAEPRRSGARRRSSPRRNAGRVRRRSGRLTDSPLPPAHGPRSPRDSGSRGGRRRAVEGAGAPPVLDFRRATRGSGPSLSLLRCLPFLRFASSDASTGGKRSGAGPKRGDWMEPGLDSPPVLGL